MQPGYKPLTEKIRKMERSGQIAAKVRAAPKATVIDVTHRRWPPEPPRPVVAVECRVSVSDPALKPTPENIARADTGLLIGCIVRTVAEHYGIHPSDLKSARVSKDVVKPRQIAAYLAIKLTGKSYPAVGSYLGGRDHTTIMHAVRVVAARMLADEDFALEVAGLLMRLAPKRLQEDGDA